MKSTKPEPLEKTAKIIIIGDSGAGKSSILIRFCQDTFYDQVKATIGFQFLTRPLEIDGKKIKINVWDTAGQEKFQSITETFYRDTNGVIFTYSISERKSFESLDKWMTQVNNYGGKNIPKVIVGNKTDEKNRAVPLKEGQEFAQKHGIKFFETSAKENSNVSEVFETLARDIKETIFDREVVNPAPANNNVRLSSNTQRTQGSGCC